MHASIHAVVEAKAFTAKDMGFNNTAGPKGEQAVAFRIKADQGAFLNCRFDGFQDTLYVHCWRQFFRDCTITGTVDFIFGNSGAVFQNCDIYVNLPGDQQKNTVTASGKKLINQCFFQSIAIDVYIYITE
jgi:pectinesterase